MIIPLEPRLEGLAEKRFFSVARQILDRQNEGDPKRIASLVDAEASRASRLRELNGQSDRYAACVRVLGDLAQLRWSLVESGYGLELHSPRRQDERVHTPDEARARKEVIRNELRPRVQQQFEDKSVRAFIRRLERPTASSRHSSIRALIADGAELQARLRPAKLAGLETSERNTALAEAVQPYLQLVEPGARDEHSGILLQDVWRYFRYTWSIPQTPIPGRKLLYLVRDAAHPAHAVIGIAALSNSAVQLVPRDERIGWSARGLTWALRSLFASKHHRRVLEREAPFLPYQGVYAWLRPALGTAAEPSSNLKVELLGRVQRWLLDGITEALGEIEQTGLVSSEEIASPTEATVERLRRLSEEFAGQRQAALSLADGAGSDKDWGEAPVDEELLDLEAKHSSNKPVHDSRRMLVRKKRAFELSRLLDARRILTAHASLLADPATVFEALARDEIRAAINTAMSAVKSRRIGTNLLEITTCGAVAPYNQMLGGKLVALMLLSPQVGADYQRRYGNEPTIIRSQLKNQRVVPDNTLVWLGTTSLFSHGSSQYERLRLPAGVIADDQEEVRFHYIGQTSGFGTVQFADETVRAIESVMRRQRGYRDVNGVFGEGASPRLRKLRSGLDALGYNSELVLLHHQERRIYAAPLFVGAASFLCGLETSVPEYVRRPERFEDASGRIAAEWRRRWLAQRLEHEPSWAKLGETPSWLLSSALPTDAAQPGSADQSGEPGDDSDGDPEQPGDAEELAFWRRLAQAGPNAIAEGLGDADFARLHLSTSLENLLVERAREGCSIVLTGNAGDGKTHLARAIQRRLGGDVDIDFVFDATAIMTRETGVQPIVERWRRARLAGRPIMLAINQYPLYKLRRELQRGLPEVSKVVERKWGERLVYEKHGNLPDDKWLILVDLSLRNPLAPSFAGEALDRMLGSPVLRRYAASEIDPNFTFNYRHLSHPEVRGRLLTLLGRVISAGGRATVRELWILCARLLFGASPEAEVPGAEQAWYSERLFESDPRFPLTEFLQRFADPAGVTHPQLDRRLEASDGTQAADWLVDKELPEHAPARLAMAGLRDQGRERSRGRFAAIKRRFYFEHIEGGTSVFKLDDSSHAEFHKMLGESRSDPLHLQTLIGAINRCYFPAVFEGMREKLFLWVGHRLDEQPTTSYVANESIPRQRLQLRRPAPMLDLAGAFDYRPDHLLLGVIVDGVFAVETSLRIDASLYSTLIAIEQGLPRHLINPGELNRLDAFIDRLRGHAPEQGYEFLTYNAEHVLASVVQMTPDYAHYVSVRRI